MSPQHIVITRFNVRDPGFASDKNQQATGDAAWMAHRMQLFEQVCLPSLQGQRQQDFTWLVLFGDHTLSTDRERIAAWSSMCPQFQPRFLPDNKVQPVVLAEVSTETSQLITTRIDNDDAFHRDALAEIRRQASGHRERELLNFRFGLSYNGQEARPTAHRFNPFVSMVENRPVDGFCTVFCGLPHGRMHEIAPVRQIGRQPYHLTVIHQRNVINRHPGDHRQMDWSRPKEWAKWFKKRVLQPARRLCWSRDLTRLYHAEEIQRDYNVNLNQLAALLAS